MESQTGFAGSCWFNVRNGCWNMNRRTRRRRGRRMGGCDHHILWPYASSDGRELMFSSKPPLYDVLKYVAPLVFALVSLYQGKTESLFEKNPAPIWCFLVVTCAYGLIGGVMEQIQTFETKWSQILRRAAIVFGVFSVVSLVSVFLPYPMSIVPLIICTAPSLVLVRPIFCSAYSLIQTNITSVFDSIRAKLFCCGGCNLKSEVCSQV